MLQIDGRTPVIIGVGEASERVGDEGYEARSAADLAARAASRALDDTTADIARLVGSIDTVGGIRQFEISTPLASAPLGRSNNYPRSVASRIGAHPRRAILEVSGGQSPQHLLTELCGQIAEGRSQVALVVGSEAISTARALARAEDRPDFDETIEGSLEDRGFGLQGLVSMELARHGLADAPSLYAVTENARRAKHGLSRRQYDVEIGELFAPFTEVAAAHPHASAPVTRSPTELITPSEANRPIADPYLRYVVARDQVNQGAAVIIASVESARELGVPEERWVYIHGHSDVRERTLMDRPDLAESPAARLAARHALDMAGLGVDEVATWDFYSCFPMPVLNTAVDGLGLSSTDARGLTVTGGLPFFGGAGNNYSMHAIAETVRRARRSPGSFGFVGANGGILDKYSTAVYSTTPREWQQDRSSEIQALVDAPPATPQVTHADGWGVIETYTVTHDREGRRTPIVIARLERTSERFVATGLDGDDSLLDLLETAEPVGQRIWAVSTGPGNRASTTPERAAAIISERSGRRRDRYEFLAVERAGHLLEVTINRPEARNALVPAAHEELSEVFDLFFTDEDLWVAIITGAGSVAFCAGNDLVHTARGGASYLPPSGFAGLTHRRHMHKPVIAAVNGYAMGGGFEAALACHLVVADAAAQFALSEVKVGLVAGAGGVVRLPRAVPEKVAHELILTGRRMDAREAQSLGIVSRLVPAGQALDGARELAAQILVNSPTSVRLSLELMEETRGIPDPVDAVTRRTTVFDDLMSSHDAFEGMSAFANKREPRWRNQ